MKNILLQHYEGELSDVAKISIRQMQEYAEKVGAEYRLLTGKPFMPELKFQGRKALCNNKLAMINKEFDEYDVVVMVDPDMVLSKNIKDNIFTDETGLGICTDHIRKNAWARCRAKFPFLTSGEHLFASGSVWRLDRKTRQKLRAAVDPKEVKMFGDTIFVDEGIMHRLCVVANIKATPENILPNKWSYCSYLPDPLNNGAFIHLRKTPPDKSETIEKIEAYNRLVKEGIINP